MFIVLELFDPKNPNIIVNEDGTTLFFDTWHEAQAYALDQLHDPIIVRIN